MWKSKKEASKETKPANIFTSGLQSCKKGKCLWSHSMVVSYNSPSKRTLGHQLLHNKYQVLLSKYESGREGLVLWNSWQSCHLHWQHPIQTVIWVLAAHWKSAGETNIWAPIANMGDQEAVSSWLWTSSVLAIVAVFGEWTSRWEDLSGFPSFCNTDCQISKLFKKSEKEWERVRLKDIEEKERKKNDEDLKIETEIGRCISVNFETYFSFLSLFIHNSWCLSERYLQWKILQGW